MIFFYSGSFLSNFYCAPFTVDGVTYKHTEQYIMYHKALLFHDTSVAANHSYL